MPNHPSQGADPAITVADIFTTPPSHASIKVVVLVPTTPMSLPISTVWPWDFYLVPTYSLDASRSAEQKLP